MRRSCNDPLWLHYHSGCHAIRLSCNQPEIMPELEENPLNDQFNSPSECLRSLPGPIKLHHTVLMGVEWKVLVESLVSYHIHIHSICLKSKEGGFNNHGYMVFKER